MKHNAPNTTGSTVIAIVLSITIVLIVVLAGWATLHKDKTTKPTASTTHVQSTNAKMSSDAVDYLTINEWKVRTRLPADFRGKVAYRMAAAQTDPDTGLTLESVNVYVASDQFSGDVCASMNMDIGPAIAAGASYIRSDNSKPFNASRYKGSFIQNILIDSTYSYHLSSVIPDCLGGGANAAKMQELQTALTDLVKA